MKRKYLIIILLPLLLFSFLSVGYAQLSVDTSIISMSGADWSLKVDSALASSIDSRNTPYMTAKSPTEKELFLELATLEDCKSGVVQFKIDMTGLTAYKQLPLTEQEISEGSFRPKNVENSFALFDDSGKKVAHIYGSKITDSKGVEVWLDQDLKDGLLTVILPKPEILETLTFPLLLDPTFGYTNVGATSILCYTSAYSYGASYQILENGSLTAISMYLNGTANVKFALYEATDEDTISGDRLVLSDVVTISDAGWYNATFTAVNVTEYSYIGIAVGDGSASVSMWYDSGAHNLNYMDGGLAVSWNQTGTVLFGLISMYITYSEIPTPTPTPTPFVSATPFPEGTMDDTDWWISILVLLLIIINIFLMMLPPQPPAPPPTRPPS